MTTNYSLSPTLDTFEALDRAFRHFNVELFDGALPAPLIMVARKRGAHGYFWQDRIANRELEDTRHEIALNPLTMGRPVPEVLSTLVHEMVHLQQQEQGKPGKGGHHNKEWAQWMKEVGLIPTSTGLPGGAETGRKVTHMIEEGGPFDLSCKALLATGFALPWFAHPDPVALKKKDKSKVKHTCPGCSTNVWGKEGVRITCTDCDLDFEAADDE